MSRRRGPSPPAGGSSPPRRRLSSRRPRRDDVRAAAAWVLERTLDSLAPAESFLVTYLPRFDARDQSLLRELVLGSLRWLRVLDHVIAAASNRPLSKIEPALLAPLRIGAYQLLFLDRVPAHAAVHEAVEQASHRTHRGGVAFTNAVLRRVARSPRVEDWPVVNRDPVRTLAIQTSHPDFLVERWLDRFGQVETRRLLDANNQPKALSLLAFKDRGGRELLAESLIDAGLEVEPSYLSPLGLTVRSGNPFDTEAYERGDFYVQDPASQAAVLLPPPEPGERILDAAAAPGGKAFAVVAVEPTVRLTLADVSLSRLDILRRNLTRLGRSFPLLAQDAGRPTLNAHFDRVILDLPCSGTGTLRKHPELKWRLSPGEVGRLSGQALRLLTGMASRVAPGGRLVAITCSLEAEENEHVVARFLGREGVGREFRKEALPTDLPSGLTEHIRGKGLWRVYPSGNHDGFTVQVLVRSPTP